MRKYPTGGLNSQPETKNGLFRSGFFDQKKSHIILKKATYFFLIEKSRSKNAVFRFRSAFSISHKIGPKGRFKRSEFLIPNVRISGYVADVRVFKEKSEYTLVLFGLPCIFLVCFYICYLQPVIPPKRFDICSP